MSLGPWIWGNILSNGDGESLGQYNTIRLVTISEKERTELKIISSKTVGHLAIIKDGGFCTLAHK